MPTLNLYTNVPVDAVTTSDILKDATKAVAKIIGKPESYRHYETEVLLDYFDMHSNVLDACLEEWQRGLKALRVDTVSKLRKALPELEREVRRPSNFVDFYSYSFCYCLTAYYTGLLLGRRVLKMLEMDEEYQGNVKSLYKKVHAAIRADPTAKKTGKEPHKQHKRFNLKKLTYEERKAKLRLHTLNAAAGADSEEED
ncbi:hypothetical protein J1N35_025483 [Gossypium stocksii]|uniref:Large ribosomal subunit protein uL18 C-terminal eukaryotes domain-containing protein n=1 Tax=Gossypium stocksii TaxID=47602 RepID=A0A9D3ZW88_9ROSI|nr:hypothetical protein J1N35_025483 [Gossypium stocksii]